MRVLEKIDMFLMNEGKQFNIGDRVIVDMNVVKKRDNSKPYLSLVRKIIKQSDSSHPSISNIKKYSKGDMAELQSDNMLDKFIGGVWVPVEALKHTR